MSAKIATFANRQILMGMKQKHTFLIFLGTIIVMCTVVASVLHLARHSVQPLHQPAALQRLVGHWKRPSQQKPQRDSVLQAAETPDTIIMGTLSDEHGKAMPHVVVSDGYNCTLTDDKGHYRLRRNARARFVFYTVPDYCKVPVHSANDRTACFYQPLSKNLDIYDFTLRRLPGGRERSFRLVVFGDPQATTSHNPYYTGPDDNRVTTTDLQRFTSETMADVKSLLRQIPTSEPVYAISMGDDVQYYGGYSRGLERQMRTALGSSRMTVFSVIGNHDQDGRQLYRQKWEDSWGPTDYSFDRGDVHFVCFNNVQFTRSKGYFQPGELSDAQMEWLRQDLALTDKSRKVVLCYHVPLTFGNSPHSGATPLAIATESGHYSSSRLSPILRLLEGFEGGFELFCGHTHFAINHEIHYQGRNLLEHCHAAACGNIWQSNINICGTPNGYYVYTFGGTAITNCFYKSTGWERHLQMTLFNADTNFNGESYAADWNLPRGRGIIVANIFNADSRWRVTATEDSITTPMKRLSGKGQDAFATGYHHRYAEAMPYSFVSKKNSYLIMNHLYYYVPRRKGATVTITATDPYGNTYRASSADRVTEPFYNYAHYLGATP